MHAVHLMSWMHLKAVVTNAKITISKTAFPNVAQLILSSLLWFLLDYPLAERKSSATVGLPAVRWSDWLGAFCRSERNDKIAIVKKDDELIITLQSSPHSVVITTKNCHILG